MICVGFDNIKKISKKDIYWIIFIIIFYIIFAFLKINMLVFLKIIYMPNIILGIIIICLILYAII